MPGVSCKKAWISIDKIRITTDMIMLMVTLYHAGGCISSAFLIAYEA